MTHESIRLDQNAVQYRRKLAKATAQSLSCVNEAWELYVILTGRRLSREI